MSIIDNQTYLREQYQDASNLNTRIRLHQIFRVNDYGWFRWVFDRFDLPEEARILELGCGPGLLWWENADRVPAGWEISLSDFSLGMLAQACASMMERPHHTFRFEAIDAQAIPYPAAHFDGVIANHFLYHVPDRKRAIAEIRRVLKPGGHLYATTIGEGHMREIPQLVRRFDPCAEVTIHGSEFPFTLENGKDQLQVAFGEVRMWRYPDALHITSAEPLADYIFSLSRFHIPQREHLRRELITFIESELAAHDGVIVIHKESGIFRAR